MASHGTCASIGTAYTPDTLNGTQHPSISTSTRPSSTPSAVAYIKSAEMLQGHTACDIKDELIAPAQRSLNSTSKAGSQPAILQYRSTRHSRLRLGSSLFAQEAPPHSPQPHVMRRESINVSPTLALARRSPKLANTDKATDSRLTARNSSPSRIPPQWF